MRKQFELTKEQFDKIIEACKPTPVMYVSGGIPIGGTPQGDANSAWCELGRELGFDGMSVLPADGLGPMFFTAEVLEIKK